MFTFYVANSKPKQSGQRVRNSVYRPVSVLKAQFGLINLSIQRLDISLLLLAATISEN